MSDSFALARARAALSEAGLAIDVPLQRASSVTNEVWLADQYVIRVNRRANRRLRREATLGALLPPEVQYPQIIAYGGQLGADWLITERLPGEMLAKAWPTMNDFERRNAVRQLAAMLRALHSVPCPPELAMLDDAPQLLDPTRIPIVEPLLQALDELEQARGVDRGLIADTRHLVLASTPALEPYTTDTLVHGDLHFQNVLWDGFTVTGLLDLEWARGAPPDVDLDVFLRFCAHPAWHVAEDYARVTRVEDYRLVPYWLAEYYPELFGHEYLLERTLLYAISYDVHELRRELAEQPITGPTRDLPEWHPHKRLENTLRGRSHLHRLAGQVAWDAEDLDDDLPGDPPLAPHPHH
ncbi:phosphotransferase family protein [Rhabdothermincola sediminis]|uniref:phosphotransferase family protein n=1 Tax=Rhabdothermincola sediminis TaxID=2751370 RepID=UPI001AA030CB|nr:phosphotransferase [Rhabdothermincola sediminis]